MEKMLPVEPFQETLGVGMCGPASLKIVLEYYGIRKTERELAELCGTTRDLGTDDRGLRRAAERLGFTVDIRNESTFEDIWQWLDRGVPVIVDWFTRGRMDSLDSVVADGHSSVVAGLDGDFIYLQDPEIGTIRKLERKSFLTVWFDFTGKYIEPDGLIIRQLIAVHR